MPANDLSDLDRRKLVQDIIFYINTNEVRRTMIKKADVFRAISGGTAKNYSNAAKDEMWRTATRGTFISQVEKYFSIFC